MKYAKIFRTIMDTLNLCQSENDKITMLEAVIEECKFKYLNLLKLSNHIDFMVLDEGGELDENDRND